MKDIKMLEKSETIQNNEKLEQLYNELNIIQENKFQGYMLRSKVDWVFDGEKPSTL
jgi:DNA polymerase III alpha subunit